MVIIRVNGHIRPEQARIVTEGIHTQARTGVIVLPSFCELLNEVPAGEEIQVLYEDGRVAELEKELQQERQRAYDLRARLCRCCGYYDGLGVSFSPACMVCDSGEMFQQKGGVA